MTGVLPAIVVMGVMGAGKSTLARALAVELKLPFVEGDDLHAQESRAKMAAGVPLTDADRWPWLARVGAALRQGGVAACSALARRHRNAIRTAAAQELLLVFLDAPRDALARRVLARTGHFVSATLLDSQLALLEPPQADERALIVGADWDLAEVGARCRREL